MDDQWTVSSLSFNSTHPNRAASFARSSAAYSTMAVTEAVSVTVTSNPELHGYTVHQTMLKPFITN